jgi:dihydroxy-acid dehydratase
LNASPEAAENGNLAILKDGDVLRVDLNKRKVILLLPEDDIEERRAELMKRGGYAVKESQTPYQDLFRRETGPLSEGMVFKRATRFQRIAQNIPRDNH